MKIPFDIKYRPQIERGEYKVVTKGGQNVRIVCWDMNTSNGTLLVALVKGFGGEYEKIRSYTLDGKCKSASKDASLFISTPETELSEFKKAIVIKKEEWQSTDSGYLNCIGVGDTYVRKQMKRIMNSDFMECSVAFRGCVCALGEDYKETWGDKNKKQL